MSNADLIKVWKNYCEQYDLPVGDLSEVEDKVFIELEDLKINEAGNIDLEDLGYRYATEVACYGVDAGLIDELRGVLDLVKYGFYVLYDDYAWIDEVDGQTNLYTIYYGGQ